MVPDAMSLFLIRYCAATSYACY